MARLCTNCPFIDSPKAYGYDSDAMEALDDGEVPACHGKVGADLIFAESPMLPQSPCVGYERWQRGDRGFRKPQLCQGAPHER